MICIECKQEQPKIIVLDTNEYSLSTYITWREDNEGLCLKCYSKKKKLGK